MPLDYLAQAEHELYTLLLPVTSPDRSQVKAALAIACNTLTQLQSDQNFFADIRRLKVQRIEHDANFRKITGEVEHFLNHFLKTEKKYLIHAGVSEEEVDVLIWFASKLRDQTQHEDLDPHRVQHLIGEVAVKCCSAAEDLAQRQVEERTRKQYQQLALRALFVIGGAIVASANAAALVVQFLSPAGTAVSGALGAAMIGAAETAANAVSGSDRK
jgi:hypothetical protein